MVASLTQRSFRLALVVCPLVAAALTVGVRPAGATIVQIQLGTEASANNGSISPTLPAASTQGTLLVAVLENGTSSSAPFSAPAGWSKAVSSSNSCCGTSEIWYYPNNPGGISSATFTASSGTASIIGQLSEWNGVVASSPLDKTGSGNHGGASSFTISTSAATTVANDIGITAFTTSATNLTSITAGTGWTHMFADLAGGYAADYKLNLAQAVASETESAVPNTSWVAAIATFKPSLCNSGPLSVSAPGSTSFSALTLNGTDQTATATLVLTPDDERNTGAGWNITGTSTTLTNGSSKTLPTTATTVTAASTATTGGNCVMPTNSITYPVTLPAAASPPTAVKLYNAAVNTGKGPTNVTLTFSLAVPANAYIGPYTSTWTFASVSGP